MRWSWKISLYYENLSLFLRELHLFSYVPKNKYKRGTWYFEIQGLIADLQVNLFPWSCWFGRDLHDNKLTGPIPPQIGRLKLLRIFWGSLLVNGLLIDMILLPLLQTSTFRRNLRSNQLQDVIPIPHEIGELKRLTHLCFSFNNF